MRSVSVRSLLMHHKVVSKSVFVAREVLYLLIYYLIFTSSVTDI